MAQRNPQQPRETLNDLENSPMAWIGPEEASMTSARMRCKCTPAHAAESSVTNALKMTIQTVTGQ